MSPVCVCDKLSCVVPVCVCSSFLCGSSVQPRLSSTAVNSELSKSSTRTADFTQSCGSQGREYGRLGPTSDRDSDSERSLGTGTFQVLRVMLMCSQVSEPRLPLYHFHPPVPVMPDEFSVTVPVLPFPTLKYM